LYSNEPEPPELIHESAHARSSGADHFGKRLLAYPSNDRLRLAILAEIRKQEEHPCQALLARIEELVG
jgi:hypothetical protein